MTALPESITKSMQPIATVENRFNSVTGIGMSVAIKSFNLGIQPYASGIKSALAGTAAALGSLAVSGISTYRHNMVQVMTQGISGILKSYDFAGLAASMNRIAIASIVPAINSYYTKFLETIDFTPLRRIAEEMSQLGYRIQYNQYAKVYCAVMYNAEWFPYLDFENESQLFLTLNEIIDTSRYGSQRQIKRINKAVLDYYTDAKVKKIKNSWKSIDIDKHYKKMLSQAVDAYLRKEYILTISCLAPLWETLLFKCQSKERHNSKVVIDKFKEMADNSDDNNITEWLIDFFETLIMGQCNGPDEVKDDLPGRHGTAHGWWRKYPSRKSALNAILLTDFILKLEPIENEV